MRTSVDPTATGTAPRSPKVVPAAPDLTGVTNRSGSRGGDVRRKSWFALALVPALLSGCGVLGLSSSGGSAGAAATAPPSGPAWIVVAQGSATPSAVPSHPAASPTPTAASGFLALAAPSPTGTPTVVCSPNTFNFSRVAAASVRPSATTAVVSWYNVGGSNLKEFRLTAISQDLKIGKQRDVGFV